MPKKIYTDLNNEQLSQYLIESYIRNKRWPSYKYWRDNKMRPSTKIFEEKFGSWRYAIYAAEKLYMVRKCEEEERKKTKPEMKDVIIKYVEIEKPKHPDATPKKPHIMEAFIRRGIESGGVIL
ncbi:MAG: hypothetical protein M0Q92_00690 [Methanoregula sp.]|nr:hypothetical protein [Methanoregula sp.]